MKLEIEQEVAQALVTYLKPKPYKEVYVFIAALMQAKPPQEPAATEPTEQE